MLLPVHICALVIFCSCAANSQSSFVIPSDVTLPLQTLLEEGSRSYYSNDWIEAIDKFEKALINYRMRSYVEASCNTKCKDSTISSQIGMDMTGFDDLRYFGDFLAQANCIKLCKEEHPYGSTSHSLPEKDVLEEFEKRKPYNFLQYAYYQLNKIDKACKAAESYYNANLDDEQAIENIEFYRSMEEVNQSFFEDLEAPKFHEIFAQAVKAYEDKNFEEATSKFERVLVEFFNAFDECQSLCINKPFEQMYFYRLYKATATQLLERLSCSSQCEKKLSPVSSNEKLSNFVATCFSYLQFSYYAMGRFELAVSTAASVLLLNPNDKNARHNMEYYESIKEEQNLSETLHFKPRVDAEKFHLRLEAINTLLQKRNSIEDEDDEMEILVDDNQEKTFIPDIADRIAAILDEKLLESINLL